MTCPRYLFFNGFSTTSYNVRFQVELKFSVNFSMLHRFETRIGRFARYYQTVLVCRYATAQPLMAVVVVVIAIIKARITASVVVEGVALFVLVIRIYQMAMKNWIVNDCKTNNTLE